MADDKFKDDDGEMVEQRVIITVGEGENENYITKLWDGCQQQ